MKEFPTKNQIFDVRKGCFTQKTNNDETSKYKDLIHSIHPYFINDPFDEEYNPGKRVRIGGKDSNSDSDPPIHLKY